MVSSYPVVLFPAYSYILPVPAASPSLSPRKADTPMPQSLPPTAPLDVVPSHLITTATLVRKFLCYYSPLSPHTSPSTFPSGAPYTPVSYTHLENENNLKKHNQLDSDATPNIAYLLDD